MSADASPVLAPLALITPVAAIVITFPVLGPAAFVAGAIGLASAIVLAAPALRVALSRGWRRFSQLLALGAVTGLMPFLLWGLVVGILDGDLRPSFSFVVVEALSMLIGAATGAIYWLVFLKSRGTPASTVAHVLAVLAVGLILSGLPGWYPDSSWPKHRARSERLTLAWSFGTAVDQHGTQQVRIWRSADPRCVASIYLPPLNEYLEKTQPPDLALDLTRISTWSRGSRVRLNSIGPVPFPAAFTFLEGCEPWRKP